MGRLKKEGFSKNFVKIISLDSCYRPFVFIIVLIFLGVVSLSFLESLPNLSICSRLFGKYCYSFGLTRGISALLKGNFSLSTEYNLLSLPVLVIIVAIIFNDLGRKFYKK